MLTDTKIRNTKPTSKPFKLYDEQGLFMIVNPNGSRWWRLRYTFDGKAKTLSLGTYPAVTLKEARQHRDDARLWIAKGTDPSDIRKAAKATKAEEKQEQAEAKQQAAMLAAGIPLPDSFEAVAREWFAKNEAIWAANHADRIIRRLERDVFPYIGSKPVAEITAPEVLAVAQRIEDRGAGDTAHRAKQNIGQVMRYAIATGRAMYDPVPSLKGALAPVKKQHFAAVTDPSEIGPLLRVLSGYKGSPIVRAALKLAPLLFVRPGELRHMEWSEVDLDEGLWKFTASKTGQDHIVPLARQAIDVLRDLHPLTGHARYVFPSARTDLRPMSSNAVLAAMRRVGIDKDEMSGHGFRAMARTVLAEVHSFPAEVVELQLAHAVRDPLGRAYNRTQYLKQRVQMMQTWADYLDDLRDQKNVIQGQFGTA